MESKASEFSNLPDRISGLGVLAENLWWSWNPDARMLFKMIDRQAWKDSVHNPDQMLRDLPPDILEKTAADHSYLGHYDIVMARFNKYLKDTSCLLLDTPPGTGDHAIAYFSAEYGLHRSLPFYAGGLGFLAGDHLKECSDLNIPLVAVGFMYPQGYLHQQIRDDGWQENVTENLEREAAPINRVFAPDGRQLTVQVPFIEPPIHLAVWEVMVGRIPLYLMDTDISQNDPWNRGISARLYIGDLEQRLRQEIVLGIGGAEVLDKLNIRHLLLHLNEGHAAFAMLECIRKRVEAGASFEDALHQVKETSVFTTHTPVAAGHDVFPYHLIAKYFRSYWLSLKLDHDAFMDLGADPIRPQDGFNMTALSLKLAKYHNAVSRRHGEVSRKMWSGLWLDGDQAPKLYDFVTNGVHVPTWIDPKMKLLYDRYLGDGWLEDHDNSAVWDLVDTIPDDELWRIHYWLKIKLIDAIRERSRRRWAYERGNPSLVLAGGTMLDSSVLTVGFARRFATYKRADLILSDPGRLKKIINSRWRPIQIIFAGKAHPADDPGKQVLQRVFNASRDPEMGGRIAFVEDYGEQMAQYMVHGVDVWLSNPMPPMEASGTSGMKAALNGVPQLSILDGWWCEGFNGKNGWAFDHSDRNGEARVADASELYRLLEDEIVPMYYDVTDDGTPHRWVKMMKETIKAGAARFSARRMVKEYTNAFYARAMDTARKRYAARR